MDDSNEPRSWNELAVALGFSRRTISEWRKMEGAPTSKSVEDWTAFIEEHDLGAAPNKTPAQREELLRQKLTEEIAILRLKRAREERRSIDLAEVDNLLLTIATRQKQHLYATLGGELPTDLEGQSATTIRARLMKVADEICDAMNSRVEDWRGDGA